MAKNDENKPSEVNSSYQCISDDVQLGEDVYISKFVNLYGCKIGDFSKIGAFAEIQRDVTIGHHCKICTNVVVCTGVIIGDNCFIGNGTIFVNDNYPRSVNQDGELESSDDWENRFLEVKVENNVSLGSNTTVIGGVTIGEGAMVGAGSVVTKSIPAGEVWAGNPARKIRDVSPLKLVKKAA